MTESKAAYNPQDVFKGLFKSLSQSNKAHLQETHERILKRVDFSDKVLITTWYDLIMQDIPKHFGIACAFEEARRAFNKSQTGSLFEERTAMALLYLAKDLSPTHSSKAITGVGLVMRTLRKRNADDTRLCHRAQEEMDAFLAQRFPHPSPSMPLSLG